MIIMAIPTIHIVALAVCSLMIGGCASSPPSSSNHMGFEEARKMFAERGPQSGQPLPNLSLVDLNGKPASIKTIQGDRPLVLVTVSLTCNVARRVQPQVDELAKRFGKEAAIVVVYVIDAHPKGDPCPYIGKEWVPKDNEKDNVLVPQPTDMAQRLALAKQFHDRFGPGTQILVDTMDNASWMALGQAPNLGLLIDSKGIIRLRQGWFDAKTMEQTLGALIAPQQVPPLK